MENYIYVDTAFFGPLGSKCLSTTGAHSECVCFVPSALHPFAAKIFCGFTLRPLRPQKRGACMLVLVCCKLLLKA